MKKQILKYISTLYRKTGLNQLPLIKHLAKHIYNYVPKPSYLNIDGNKIYVHKEDDFISHTLYLNNVWEPFETQLIRKLINSEDIVVDIGAHIGYYTLLTSKLVGKKGAIYSFEPDPDSFKLLKKNVEENNLTNVTLIKKAVSNKNSSTKLYISSDNKGDHRIFKPERYKRLINIESTTLDTFFKQLNRKINLIKMDIQGAEINAIKGMLHILSKNENLKLILEFWPYGYKQAGNDPKELFIILEKYHFKYIYKIDDHNNKIVMMTPGQLLLYSGRSKPQEHVNLLFLRKNMSNLKTH